MKKLVLFSLFTIIIFGCKNLKNLDIADQKGIWSEVISMDGSKPLKRHEAAFVGVGNQFYLIGGRRIQPVSIYDTKSNIWREGPTIPIEMHHLQPVVVEDKIYILGAFTGKYPGETPIEHIYIYHTKTDTWEKGAAIPKARLRGAAGAVLYNDKIYMVCGIKDGHRGDHKNWLDAYDLKTGQWEELPDAPRPRDHFQAIVAEDQLFVLGGRTTIKAQSPFKNTIAEIDVFDFRNQSWKTLPEAIPTKRAGNYAILIGNEILVLGGESFGQRMAHNEVEALHTKNYTWRTLNPMLQGRHGTGVIEHNRKLYVASGSGNKGGGPELTTMECLSFE